MCPGPAFPTPCLSPTNPKKMRNEALTPAPSREIADSSPHTLEGEEPQGWSCAPGKKLQGSGPAGGRRRGGVGRPERSITRPCPLVGKNPRPAVSLSQSGGVPGAEHVNPHISSDFCGRADGLVLHCLPFSSALAVLGLHQAHASS